MTDQRPRILGIDDTPELLLKLVAALATDFDLQIATSGAMGLALAMDAPPDLILLDVKMPAMEGFETCRLLKAEPALKDVPVVFVSAFSALDLEMKGLALGAADFLGKPINVEIARLRIRNLLERERLRKEVEAQRDLLKDQVAERKDAQAEEMLRKLYTAVEQSPVSVVITDLEVRIQYVNPRFAEATGYNAAEVIGQNPRILQSGQTAREIYQALWGKLSSGEAWHGELLNRRKNGELYWEEANVAPVKDLAGTVTHYVAVKTDITMRKQAEIRLAESEHRLQTLIQAIPDLVWLKDPEGIYLACNPRFENFFGAREKDIVGKTDYDFVDRELADFFRANDRAAMEAKDTHVNEEWVTFASDGHRELLETSKTPMFDAQGNLSGVLGIGHDISERKQSEEQVRLLAFYDPLTQLPNRRLLNDRLSQAMAASKRSGCYGAVMFLDLDNFKSLNDTHGHVVGDLLLIEAADRLKNCARGMDTVARFGGDEFMVVISDLNVGKAESVAQAKIIAEKIRVALAKPYVLKIQHHGQADTSVGHHCTVSIGVALFVNHDASPDDILKWADTAMYQAKEAGRNMIRFWD